MGHQRAPVTENGPNVAANHFSKHKVKGIKPLHGQSHQRQGCFNKRAGHAKNQCHMLGKSKAHTSSHHFVAWGHVRRIVY